MRWKELLHLAVPALVVIGLIGWSRPVGPSAAAGVAAIEEDGCYLNFVAQNGSDASIFIDMSRSRIRAFSALYGVGYWTKITNTSNQNVHAGTRRSFTVWAKTCGLTGYGHQVDFILKKGADTKSERVTHGGGDKTVSLGDLKRYFE